MKRIFIFAAAALIGGGCGGMNTASLTSGGLKALQAFTLSDAEVEQYVEGYIEQLDAQHTIAAGNDPYNVRLQRIAGPINNQDGIIIKVYKTADVNAFAVADGNIRVYSGLMDAMSDEEVLGVIGHEIGHVKLNHTRKAFQAALATSGLVDAAASLGGVMEKLPGSVWDNIAQSLASASFSRLQEEQADDYGYEFLVAHGLNPWAMALSFEKLKQMEEAAGSTATGPVLQLFSTHPNLDTRIKRMSERASKDGYQIPGSGSSTSTQTKSTTSDKWSF